MAKRKIRDNQTGQIFEVDDTELGKYGLSMPPATPQAPQPTITPTPKITKPQVQKGSSFGEEAINFLSNLLIPQTKKLAGQVATGNVPAPELQDILGFNLASQSPFEKTKNKVGAELASFAIPFGKGIGALQKILGPGAAVGALQGVSEDNATPQTVAGNTVLGAGGAGILGVLGKAATAATKATGKGLQKTGEDLALRSLRPSPSQLTKFQQETGEDLGKFLTSRKLAGADYEKVVKHTQGLQKQFDDIVLKEDLTVDPNAILGKFSKEIERLNKSIIPADKQKAEQLQTIAGNFIDKYGEAPLSAKKLTLLRRELDDSITKFNLDEAVKGPLNLTRDVIQDSLREGADKAGLKIGELSLKDAGRELSKLYKVMGIAEKQGNVGRGSMPLGITDLLGGNIMSTIGGSIAGPVGAIVGGASGIAASNIAKRPAFVSRASTAAGNAGRRLETGSEALNTVLSGATQVGGQIAARTPSLLGRLISGEQNSSTNQNSGYDNNQNGFQNNVQGNISPTNSIPQDVNIGPERQITSEQMQQVYMAQAQGLISAKTADAIQKAYDVQEKSIKAGQGKSGTPTEFDKKFDFAGRQAYAALQVLDENKIESGPFESLKSVIGETTGTQKKEITDFKSKLAVARTSARNALLGANMSEQEIKSLLDFVFDFNQPTPILRQRLQSFVESMNDYRANVAGGGVDAETLMQGLGQ